MAIMVIGGAGFIGSNLCEEMIKGGEKIVCVDNFNDYYSPRIKEINLEEVRQNKLFKLYKVDITNYNNLREVFEKEKPKKVVMLAARAGVRRSSGNPGIYAHTNICGLLNVLELSKDYKIEKLIFASSSSVYGIRENGPFKEDDNVSSPASVYAATKRAGELLCKTYNHNYNLPIVCLRFFTVYGPRNRPDMATYRYLIHILGQKTLDVYYGDTKRSYTYVSDITDGIKRALNAAISYEIINLGGSEVIHIDDYISTIEKVTGKKLKMNKIPVLASDVNITSADITKAKRLLGWEPKVNLEIGLKNTYDYFLEFSKKYPELIVYFSSKTDS